MQYDYAVYKKRENDFPLWSVFLRKNWNLGELPQSEGEFQLIRIFYTRKAASIFTSHLNASLAALEDVAK